MLLLLFYYNDKTLAAAYLSKDIGNNWLKLRGPVHGNMVACFSVTEIDIKELTSNFLNSLRASLKDVSNEDSYDQMFEEFENRNHLPISTQVIQSTLKNGNIISLIMEHSQHVSLKNNQELYKLFEEEKTNSINNFQAHLSSDELEFDEFIKKFREETK